VGLLFPALMACQMLGSAVSAMVLSGPWNVYPEDLLRWIFVSAALSFVVPAYDYQVLMLYCLDPTEQSQSEVYGCFMQQRFHINWQCDQLLVSF
jgi:hypothetical protein